MLNARYDGFEGYPPDAGSPSGFPFLLPAHPGGLLSATASCLNPRPVLRLRTFAKDKRGYEHGHVLTWFLAVGPGSLLLCSCLARRRPGMVLRCPGFLVKRGNGARCVTGHSSSQLCARALASPIELTAVALQPGLLSAELLRRFRLRHESNIVGILLLSPEGWRCGR